MKPAFVEILACPRCGARFRLEEARKRGAEVEEGVLSCGGGHRFPVTRGVPRFVSDDAYVGSFSFEWNTFSRVQLDVHRGNDESERTFAEKTGFRPDTLKGRRVLDVGVGAGRFSDVASRWGAEVVGIDLSFAVDAAARNLGDRENVHLAQADVFALPFPEQSFDAIFSLGVLHHTPDTRRAFEALLPLLRPGGEIAIWVYDAYHVYRVSDFLRRIARRLPRRLLYALCWVAVPLYWLAPLRGLFFHLFRLSMHPDARTRWLDTFDWYSPAYQWKHSYPEVFAWFREGGLEAIEPLEHPVSMRGRRPRGTA